MNLKEATDTKKRHMMELLAASGDDANGVKACLLLLEHSMLEAYHVGRVEYARDELPRVLKMASCGEW